MKALELRPIALPTTRGIEPENKLRRHQGMNRSWALLCLFLLDACSRSPLGVSARAGTGGSGSAASGVGGTAPGSAGVSPVPVARIGDDGVCDGMPCPDGQQCCLSTGHCVNPSRAI